MIQILKTCTLRSRASLSLLLMVIKNIGTNKAVLSRPGTGTQNALKTTAPLLWCCWVNPGMNSCFFSLCNKTSTLLTEQKMTHATGNLAKKLPAVTPIILDRHYEPQSLVPSPVCVRTLKGSFPQINNKQQVHNHSFQQTTCQLVMKVAGLIQQLMSHCT